MAVFALEVGGKATLAFDAPNLRAAQELCREAWLLDDLACLNSGGRPVYKIGSRVSVRRATADEAAIFDQASEAAPPSDEMVLAYLIVLDGP